jgi:DNA-binding LacI/PurR family transcriptional regulator/signal transduction histidine kinase/ActR/RegA family two-component response regulator
VQPARDRRLAALSHPRARGAKSVSRAEIRAYRSSRIEARSGSVPWYPAGFGVARALLGSVAVSGSTSSGRLTPGLETRGEGSSSGGRPRRTIAVLSDYMTFFGGGYESEVREAFHTKCRELDLDLVLAYGRALDEPNSSSRCHNEIFDLMRSDRVDGVVVISSSLSSYRGLPSIQELVARLAPMPITSLGLEVPEVPSVLIDNLGGMRAVIEHLVREHDRRRIAFIAGLSDNTEAKDRLEGYRQVLEEHGIPFDPALVEGGNFVSSGGKVAMTRLLERGVEFDAVAAASDAMALGAIEALRARGLRVPRDLSVTGFDDLVVARLGNPPLTTVAQPYERMAEAAMQLLLRQLAGESVPLVTQLATEFFPRRSCGCMHGRRERLPRRQSDATASVSDECGHDWTPRLRVALTSSFRASGKGGAEDAERLLQAVKAELAGESRAFTLTIEEMLDESGGDNERYRALHSAVSCLREELRGITGPAFDDVLFDALGSVALANTTAQAQHRLEIDDAYHRLLTSGNQSMVAFDLPSLQQAFEKSLLGAGVRTAYVSRWSDAPNELEPFVCMRNGEPVAVPGGRYLGSELMPEAAWADTRQKTFLLFPLAFETQRQGVVAFEYHVNTNGYQVLRDQLSAALMTVGLHQELVKKTLLHERSVQERLATSKRIEWLSMLAGGVAHDLNNALGPMVALPDVILAELGDLGLTAQQAEDVFADVESIRVAALRATQTIKDLLTLGRQGKTRKEPFDLNKAIRGCVFGGTNTQSRHVAVALDLGAGTLAVRGSESHVVRAITNLVRNGVEAIVGSGHVTVKTFAKRVQEPIAGLETIQPGDYAVVEVSDDGEGIPGPDLARVFEPFFSTKRMHEQSGTGLGLAIVHGVIQEHAGFIDVTSTPGVGTTFTLYFPRTDEPLQHPESEPSPRGKAKILFVDDERIQLRTGARVLSHLGYTVDTLESGRKAHDLFVEAAVHGFQSPYDLVILDMLLDESEDGLQVFERIQRLFPAQKAIIASGHAPNQRAEHAVAKGVAWLVKPYTRNALASAIEVALGSNVRERP